MIFVAGLLLAACSSTPHNSIATDQRAVDVARGAVARDQSAQCTVSATLTARCFGAQSTAQAIGCATNFQRCEAAVSKATAKLKADEFKLQVAQDQLKKDESGG